MIILRPKEVCNFSTKCPYNSMGYCQGANPDRNLNFECDYVDEEGNYIQEGMERNQYDKTGKMNILMESSSYIRGND